MFKLFSKQSIKTLSLLALTLLAITAFITALINLSLHWPHPQPTDVSASLLYPYWITYTILFLALSLTVYLWHRRDPFSIRISFWIILLVAIVSRLIVVFATQPTLSDDIWRYIHDGAALSAGLNPYQTPPAEFTPEQSPSPPEVTSRINHPKMHTIYLPISQYFFAFVSLFKVQTWDQWGDKTFRLAFILCDIGIVILMLKYFAKRSSSLWLAALYAWHPLPISEVAGSGHQDVIGILPLIGALILYQSAKTNLPRLYITGKLFALSLAVKPIMLALFLPMLWWLRKTKKRMVALILSTIKILILVFIPFLFLPGSIRGLVQTSQIFAHQWTANSSLYPFILDIFRGYKEPTLLTIIAFLLLLVIFLMYRRCNLWRLAIIYTLASLLLSSTVHPWYLLWLLALIPFHFNLAAWVFTLTISLAYVTHIKTVSHHVPTEILMIEYIPVYLLVIWSIIQSLRHQSRHLNVN